jgi:hypothetical protein
MDWWSCHVETRTDSTGLLDDNATGRFADLAAAHHGVVAAGGIPEGWSATVSVEAGSAAEAVGEAVRIVTGIAKRGWHSRLASCPRRSSPRARAR